MSSFIARRAIAAPRFARAFSNTSARPLAKITIVGNLAATPELSATSTGREVVRYSVASNSGRGDNQKVSWFRVTSFENEGPRRDLITSLPKGTLIWVDGEATNISYEDAEGKSRSSFSIIQRHIEVLRRPKEDSSSE